MIDIQKLKARHEEELKDVETYREMADNCNEYSQIFCDIAEEENEHAHMLEYIIEHM